MYGHLKLFAFSILQQSLTDIVEDLTWMMLHHLPSSQICQNEFHQKVQ